MDGLHDTAQDNVLRLLILTDSPIMVSGGSERFLRNLLGKLPAEKCRATLVQLCQPPSATAILHHELPASVDRAIFLPFAALYGKQGLRAFMTVRGLVKREGFDVIQSQHEKSDFFNALLPRGARNALRISSRRDTGFLKSRRLRQLSRLLNRRLDIITAPSTAILDAVEQSEGISHNRTYCIPNGVDTDSFQPSTATARREVRADIGCTSSDLLIGCVADLFPIKRHQDLIDAFASVHAQFPQAKLVLVGDGPLREAIEAQIRDLALVDAVKLLGSRRDVDVLLPALDLFALASDTEGLSNAILEAQACGLPVIATDVGGNPDIVDADRGCLIAPRNPGAMANALCGLLGNPILREKMGAVARARVVQHHSLDAMAQAYAALYRERPHVQ